MSIRGSHLIWIDLEMTGLDCIEDHIIEIATIVTDKHLNILAEGPVFAIHHPEETLAKMDEWNQNTHGKSGLLQRVQESTTTLQEAEQETLEFLKQYLPARRSPMCGNSICQDRRFLFREMPELENFFHYRNLDVSTLKELANRWFPELSSFFTKSSSHLALDDIRDSIHELKVYREHFLQFPQKESILAGQIESIESIETNEESK